jgi:hypothetical protein
MSEPRTIVDDEGIERIVPEAPRKQKCSVCDKALKPLLKCTPDPDDWVWRECDFCDEPCCVACSECDEQTGLTECNDCYESRLARSWQRVFESGY